MDNDFDYQKYINNNNNENVNNKNVAIKDDLDKRTLKDKFIERNISIESSEQCSSSKTKFQAPDGGWGWVIVFASFMINMISDGIPCSFGVIFVDLNDHFKAGKSKTSWVGSIFLSIPLLTGPLASALTDRFGCRKVTIVSGVLSALGFIIGYYASTLEQLFIAFSISGIGLSLSCVASVVIVAYYFEKRRSLATGLSVCGTGIGTFIFPPLTIYLLNEFTWRGTLLIYAGIFLNIIVFGALMRDLDFCDDDESNSSSDYSSETRSINEKIAPCQSKTYLHSMSVNESNNNDINDLSSINNCSSSLINIPTYISHNGSISLPKEILTEISSKENSSLRKLFNRFPNLECNYLTKNSKLEPPKNKLKLNGDESNPSNGSKHSLNIEYPKRRSIIKNARSPSLFSLRRFSNSIYEPRVHYLRNLKLPRGSITYRGAMLNIKKYKLRPSSSAPDIYRNSMMTINVTQQVSIIFMFRLFN